MIRRKSVRIKPVGSDGSAVATASLALGRPGFVRAIKINFENQPATTDIVVKADGSSGATLGTFTSGNTDIALKPVGMPGIDEGNAALAATDASAGGWPFLTGLYISVAEADSSTADDHYIDIDFLVEQ